MARLGGRLREQRQVQHRANSSRNSPAPSAATTTVRCAGVNSDRSACASKNRSQRCSALESPEPSAWAARAQPSSLRVVILQQALCPLRQHLRKTTRGGQRRIETNVQVHRANRLGRLLAPVLGATTGQRIQATPKA